MDEHSQTEDSKRITRDHPFLTAYALGEADEEIRRQVEAALLADPGLLDTIEEIRSTGQDLEAALSLESFREERAMAEAEQTPHRRHHLLRFPALYFVIGSVSAACFAVIVALHVSYSEVVLRPGQRPLLAATAAPVPAEADAKAITLNFKTVQSPAEPGQSVEKEESDSSGLTEALASGLLGRTTGYASTEGASKPSAVAEVQDSMAGSRLPAPAALIATAPAAEETLRNNKDEMTAQWSQPFCYGGGSSMRIFDTEDGVGDRPFVATAMRSASLLGANVGGASYARLVRSLQTQHRPAAEEIRIEELLNAFSFAYTGESAGMERRETGGEAQAAVNADIEIAPAPWAQEHTLVRIGVQARKVPQVRRAPERFLILADFTGALAQQRNQDMLRDSLRSLVTRLHPEDEVRLAWRGEGRLTVETVHAASEKWTLFGQIDALGEPQAANNEPGELAMVLAQSSRILVCTSGEQPLPQALENSRLPLSVLAWGSSPAPSEAILRLSGRSSFRVDWADTPGRARALLLEQAGEGSQVVARGARLELRFNPGAVAAYRLIGYEDRAGSYSEALPADLVSGQSFTALYELVPAGQRVPDYNASSGSLAYKSVPAGRSGALGGEGERELFRLTLDYGDTADSRHLRRLYRVLDGKGDWNRASEDFRLAASVAGFGMILRDSPYRGKASLAKLEAWAGPTGGSVPASERREFLQLIRQAEKLGYR